MLKIGHYYFRGLIGHYYFRGLKRPKAGLKVNNYSAK